MNKIFDSINDLIRDSYGGVLALWFIVAYFFKDCLQWMGAKIAEGAIGDFVKKSEPTLDKKLEDKLKEPQDKIRLIEEKVNEIEKKMDKMLNFLDFMKSSNAFQQHLERKLKKFDDRNDKRQ